MKPLLLACVVLASAGAGVAVAIWLAPVGAPKDARAVSTVASASPSEPADTAPPAHAQETVAAPKGLEELQTACPSLMWELTEECAAALARRFDPKSILPRLPLLPEVTVGDVYAIDEATLAKVEAALSRPECRVPPGRFRPELRQRCAAHDMAMLALLHWDCSKWVDADPDRSKRVETETMLEEARWDVEPKGHGWLDEATYLRYRRNNAHLAYARAWEYHQCQPRRPVLRWRGLKLDHVRDISAGPPDPFYVDGGGDTWLMEPLLEAAARVGSEVALVRRLLVYDELKDEHMASMFAEFEAHNPTLAQAKLERIAERADKALAHAMAAQMLARLQGVEARWPWGWAEDGRWVGSRGWNPSFDEAERQKVIEEAKRIVARIAGQRGWDATALDWSKVAETPRYVPAERDWDN